MFVLKISLMKGCVYLAVIFYDYYPYLSDYVTVCIEKICTFVSQKIIS